MIRRRLGLHLVLLAVLVSGCGTQQSKSDASTPTRSTLSVDQLVKEGENLSGPVTVRGVVRSASNANGILTLIDAKEYETCGLSNCCLFVPVRWQGDMPALESKVRVTGAIEKSPDGLVLVAASVTADTPETSTPQ